MKINIYMIKTRKISYLLIILSLFLSQDSLNAQKFFLEHPQINPFSYKIEKSAVFKKAAVSSAHPLASLVGSAIMQDGGNAYDAAIAVQFVLAVVYPQAGNLGGGGFLLTYQKNGKIWGLDYRESAPKLATKNMYLNADGNLIENISRDGPLAVGVPGTVAGIFETLKYAKLPLEKLILPAIELAEFGFAITQHEAENLNEVLPEMETNSASKHFSFNKKKIWQASDTLIQTDLAETLKRILKQGKKGFYEGETAQYIVNEMNQSPLHKGIIS
ncbi:MAG: gamma-glutamyltransferase, partial [Limnohabitans sp.]|nr:gamma-glutamyltransferase [Limnohabitans sp.]